MTNKITATTVKQSLKEGNGLTNLYFWQARALPTQEQEENLTSEVRLVRTY